MLLCGSVGKSMTLANARCHGIDCRVFIEIKKIYQSVFNFMTTDILFLGSDTNGKQCVFVLHLPHTHENNLTNASKRPILVPVCVSVEGTLLHGPSVHQFLMVI